MNTTLRAGVRLALTISTFFLVAGCTTYSGDGDNWLGKEQEQAKHRAMMRKGMAPVSIDCRMDVGEQPEPYYQTKITYAPNPDDDRWRYGVGDAKAMQGYANAAARENLKLVSQKHIADPKTGRRASCAVWRTRWVTSDKG